jgi:uncharacterized protein with HEPN domain
MRREIQKCLFDIKESIDSIYDYLGDKRDFNDYKSYKLLRRGIERELGNYFQRYSQIKKAD